mmetsp:Transcript_66703/g.157413  ORF Transcript_66703/g.157413 Transcript_66703/m.157413 type:complete len:308 (+) Transcript_66703:1260-2183(+)
MFERYGSVVHECVDPAAVRVTDLGGERGDGCGISDVQLLGDHVGHSQRRHSSSTPPFVSCAENDSPPWLLGQRSHYLQPDALVASRHNPETMSAVCVPCVSLHFQHNRSSVVSVKYLGHCLVASSDCKRCRRRCAQSTLPQHLGYEIKCRRITLGHVGSDDVGDATPIGPPRRHESRHQRYSAAETTGTRGHVACCAIAMQSPERMAPEGCAAQRVDHGVNSVRKQRVRNICFPQVYNIIDAKRAIGWDAGRVASCDDKRTRFFGELDSKCAGSMRPTNNQHPLPSLHSCGCHDASVRHQGRCRHAR